MANGVKISESKRVASIPIPAALPSTTSTDIPMANAKRTLSLLLNGQVNVDGGGADGVLTAEGILSLLSEVRVIATPKSSARMSGGILKRFDFAAAYRLAAFLNASAGLLSQPTPIVKGSANSPFVANVDIDFEMPWSKEPRLTMLQGGNLDALVLECDWRPYTDVFSAGTITAGAAAPKVDVSEKFYSDEASQKARVMVNFTNYQEKLVTAAQSDFTFHVKGGARYLRGILLKSFTRNAVVYHTPVDTIIQSIEVKANTSQRKYWDSLNALKAENQKTYGVAAPTGYAFVDFMGSQDWHAALDKKDYGTVDLILNVAGIANGVVRAYPVEVGA